MEYSYAVEGVEAAFHAHVQRIREFLALSLSEADTRARLIDPILSILGYDHIGDLRREVPIPATREFVDYELRIDGQPRALVEAKALRHAITDQDAGQCVQYASVLGVPWCLITNGVVWQVFYAHATGPLASKKVAEVRLDGDDQALAEAWRVLSMVAKDSLVQMNPLTRLLVERVVIDELSRSDSPAVLALRRAVRDRFREQVPVQAVLEAVDHIKSSGPPDSAVVVEHEVTSHVPNAGKRPGPRRTGSPSTSLALLVEAGLLPSDATLECKLYGVSHAARLRGGQIDLNGRLYDSPSAAAAALRDGKASNGWIVWKYKGEYLADLRTRLPAVSGSESSGSATPPAL